MMELTPRLTHAYSRQITRLYAGEQLSAIAAAIAPHADPSKIEEYRRKLRAIAGVGDGVDRVISDPKDIKEFMKSLPAVPGR
jgi:hypothetical protein